MTSHDRMRMPHPCLHAISMQKPEQTYGKLRRGKGWLKVPHHAGRDGGARHHRPTATHTSGQPSLERAAIVAGLAQHYTSPLTGLPLSTHGLVPNEQLALQIQAAAQPG